MGGAEVAVAQTTAEEERQSAGKRAETELRTAGQRQVNLILETTQQRIALAVIGFALFVSATLAIGGKVLGSVDIQLAAIVFLFGVANLVTGFYFGRTNHQRSGGVGGDTAGTR